MACCFTLCRLIASLAVFLMLFAILFITCACCYMYKHAQVLDLKLGLFNTLLDIQNAPDPDVEAALNAQNNSTENLVVQPHLSANFNSKQSTVRLRMSPERTSYRPTSTLNIADGSTKLKTLPKNVKEVLDMSRVPKETVNMLENRRRYCAIL